MHGKFLSMIAVGSCLTVAGFARAADISGYHEDPNAEFGRDAGYKLAGDATFGWRTGTVAGDIDLNGHSFVMETGGGNGTVFSGAIIGKGSFEWRGGGVPQLYRSILCGDRPNTFTGVFTLTHGVMDLDKPAGVDAIPGDLVIGSNGDAVVRLDKPNQINDAAHVTMGGSGISGLELQGHDETFGSLTLGTHAVIDLGDKPAALVVGDSSARPWDLTKTLTIRSYKPGKDKLVFGRNGKGLSKEQLARIGFADPAGMSPGLYTAKMKSGGQLRPDARVTAANPPFDLLPRAISARAKLYEVAGLARLAGKDSPLKDGMTIDFFGDSITWQNGYIGAIEQALRDGEGTRGKSIKLVNRGINGGGVQDLRDGSAGNAFPGNTAQKPFAEVIAGDKAGLAVVFIGVNDVWWRNTAPDVFEKALRDLAASARSNQTTLVLATISVHGELPDGKNGDDPKIEQYSGLARKVAQDTGAALVDLRSAYVAYLQNSNAQLRVDGTLYFKPAGVLTYDGVHPSGAGNNLLANLIADGIFRALKRQIDGKATGFKEH